MDRKRKKIMLMVKKYSLEMLQIIIGTALVAGGVSFFLLPTQLSSGGFTGIATIIYYLFKFPIGTTILVLNIPLFIIAFIKIGKFFLTRALIGTMLLSFFLDIFEQFAPLTEDRFLACIYGGIIVGLGIAIVLRANASTGGTDLVSSIVKAYKPTAKTSNLIRILDIIIVASNVIVFREIEIGLYSAIVIYIVGKMIDIVFEGIDFSKMMIIISDKYGEIAEKIGDEIERGSTGIYAKGMYTNEEKMMLLCIASRGEVIKIRQISNEIDPKSFIIISNAREVFGKGFKKE